MNPKKILEEIERKQFLIEETNKELKTLKLKLENFKINKSLEDFLLDLEIERYNLNFYEINECNIDFWFCLDIRFELNEVEENFLKESIKNKGINLSFNDKNLFVEYTYKSIRFDLNKNNLLDIIKIFKLDIRKIEKNINSHKEIDEFRKIIKMIDSLPLEFL